ncbi:MAG TPA: MopE-related protein [Polyangia bacterium]|nr:MopE-related protein [Polyangia bacterium]
MATAIMAAGCQDHLYDFGVSVVPTDAGKPDAAARTDSGSSQTGGRLGTGGALPDGGSTAGAGGHGGVLGTGGGSGGTAGTDGGFNLCNPNSPELQTDIANCGTCFHQCIVPNATPSCVAGKCQFTCQTGFFDADGDPSNGCECTKTNGGIEACDGIDNDCNGTVDDHFNLMTDADNCGACNHTCAFPFAMASCDNGVCKQGACLANFYDRDPTVPGCETQCIKTNGGVETCDGFDNDCDGIVDDNLQPPTITCLTKGVCAGTQPTCGGQTGWVCNYPATYEPVEDKKLGCDGLDNDCNGQTDEPFQIGKTCIFGTGPCAGTGTWVCDNSMADNHRCMGSMKTPQTEICDGIDNDCDGLIDELDSASNRTSDDVLVYIPSKNVTMYAYEATRYDASPTSSGFDSTKRGCSVPGKLPWANVTAAEAQKACSLIGPNWRLCTAAEWQAACQGANPSPTIFPYGAAFSKTACNGADYQSAMGLTPSAIPTGSDSMCVSTFAGPPVVKLYDMSGNVKEWVATDLTTTKPPSNPGCTTTPCAFEMRGGAYDQASFTVGTTPTAPGLQCDATIPAPYSTDFTTGTTTGIDVRLPSVGFRCCLTGTLPP